MFNKIISIKEHSYCSSLFEEELIVLLKSNNKLVESIDLQNNKFKTGYYIGISWLANLDKILLVTPKLDNELQKIDYFLMLSKGLQHPEMLHFSDDLFSIDFEAKPISIPRNQDIITPLVIINFLQLLHSIVKKGLKKDYFRVRTNLHATVKGKILVATTLKRNTSRNKRIDSYCSYDEYGINNQENRLLKQALKFVISYLKLTYNTDQRFDNLLSYIIPAFKDVDDEIHKNQIKLKSKNTFFPEYEKGLKLAQLILKRFGFNLNGTLPAELIEIQPFWINMPKLFEFYVLGLLKENLKRNEIIFQFGANYGDIDYLCITKGKELVIDAKYKRIYQKEAYDIDDIRQLSGYARDLKTLKHTMIPKEKWETTVLNCLIIYPSSNENYLKNFNDVSLSNPIKQFQNFYKIGVQIPLTF